MVVGKTDDRAGMRAKAGMSSPRTTKQGFFSELKPEDGIGSQRKGTSYTPTMPSDNSSETMPKA